MRPASPLIAAGFALAVAGQALAADQTTGASNSTTATPPPSQSTTTTPPPGDTTTTTTTPTAPPPGDATTAPTAPPPGGAAPSASTAGANTSATTPPAPLQVGETVKDNTGASIGTVSSLTKNASGQQMALIKMGSDAFQVPVDRLGSADGVATINMTQAQISGMLHPAH